MNHRPDPRHHRSAAIAVAILVLAACHRVDRDLPLGKLTSTPWDDAALQQFAAHDIAPPRTLRTGEHGGGIDLDAMRAAIADPVAIDAARLERSADAAAPSAEVSAAAAPRPMPTAAPPATATPGGERGDRDGGAWLERESSANELRAGLVNGAAEPLADVRFDLGTEKRLDDAEDLPADLADGPRTLTAPTLARRSVGKVLFRNAQGAFESLIPRAFRVQVLIDGPRARTTVEYVFQNPHDRQLEGTFHYSLPAGASPAQFGMFRGGAVIEPASFGSAPLLPSLAAAPPVPADALAHIQPADLAPRVGRATLVADWGERQTAHVVEQRRAREVYEAVVRRSIDPALLEWAGGNTFQARVFPIEALATKRVFLVFEETLPLVGDGLRYQHPLPADGELGEIDVRISVREASLAIASIRGKQVAPERQGGWSSVDLSYRPGEQDAIEIDLTPPDADSQTLVESNPGGLGGAAFFTRVRPELPRRELSTPTDRALFVVDTSLSCDGPYRGLSGDLIRAVLERDPTIREYAVMLFDLRPRWLHAASWRTNDAAARGETLAELERVYLEGATSFDAVLDEIDQQRDWLMMPAHPPTAFLISDGEITWGQERIPELLRRATTAAPLRWITYELGTVAANRSLFDGLSALGEGRTVSVLAADQIDAAATAHRIAPAILKDVRVLGAHTTDLVVAGEPRLLFAGQDLRIAGRVDQASGATLEVEVLCDGTPSVTRVPLDQAGDSPLAGRAFAELYANRLLALDDERLHRMVVALSQRFSLANQAASLLILDSDADWQRFALEDERVDLADLETLRAQEEDQRLERLQGIALDDVPADGRALVASLERLPIPDALRLPATPLLDRPLTGGDARIVAEVDYRRARAGHEMDFEPYRAVAEARALAGDTLGALRAWSTLVETRPGDTEAGRLVGYASLALGQFGPASELFERIRLRRPFEPQAYLEEALALEAAGRLGAAARRFEIVLARTFPRHQHEARVVAARHYARLLRGVARDIPDAPIEDIARRITVLAPIAEVPAFSPEDLQLTLHWSSDSVDIDLWVIEPEGESCSYQHRETAAGGRLLWDITDGYGPELYHRPAGRGTFEVVAHFYGNNSQRWSVPTGALVVADRGVFGAEDQFTRRFQCFVLGKQSAYLSLRKEQL